MVKVFNFDNGFLSLSLTNPPIDCYLRLWMTATTHALVGAAIIHRFPHLGGLLFALFSHFPLDYLPHWDTIDNGRDRSLFGKLFVTGLDVLLGLGLVWFFFGGTIPSLILLASVFSAQLPDWLSAPYFFFKINFSPSRLVREFQAKYHHKADLPFGLLIQIALILLTFLLLGIIPL